MKSKKYTQKASKRSKKAVNLKLWVPVAAALLAVCAVAVLELTNTTHWFHKGVPSTKIVKTAGSPTPTPKNNVSAGSDSQKSPAANNGHVVGGGATSTTGPTNTDPSTWITSQSGNITVKQPAANAKLQSGTVLSGSAKVDKVNFRLIDNAQGVISEGTLDVVNGNFSGTLSFTPHSSSGRLDVFSTDSDGVELNEIQISEKF